MFITIVNIGYAFEAEFMGGDDPKRYHSLRKVWRPFKARDDTQYIQQYNLSTLFEPIAINEYVQRIANMPSTHVLILDDVLNAGSWDSYSEFHELVLTERPGRCRLTYVSMFKCIPQLLSWLEKFSK